MFREGIGDNSEFASYHPLVNLVYFVLAIGITMFSLSPVFLIVTLSVAWIYSLLLKGKSAIKMNLLFTVSILFVMAFINTFFTHNGDTVLFYLNSNAITLEALIYGVCTAAMLISVIIWFSCFNVIMSADKLIYIFGKVAPVLGLTLSMIFRFIPLLQKRFQEIRTGQSCMGKNLKKGFINKARQLTKEVSILISWSLEASIESADSMEARGYGLKGRTSFHLYKFTKRDAILTTLMAAFGVVTIVGCALGKTSVFFYPVFSWGSFDVMTIVTLVSYIILLFIPIIVDYKGEMKWKQLNLEM